MNIQYYGHSCFKITTKPAGRATEDVVIFIDPFNKSIGLRPPQGQTNIVLVSHNHSNHNNVSALKGDPVVINTPGEYSVRGVNVTSIESFHDDKKGAERGNNTIFIIESEGVTLCHLGDLGTDLDSKDLEKINGIDVLFIPVGGKYTIDGKTAGEIVRKIEPAMAIPMHYKIKGTNLDISDEKKFCNEMGNCPKEKTAKLNIKSKNLEEKNTEVVIMSVE